MKTQQDYTTRQDFISVDKQTVRSAYGEFFKVGEEVGHEGADDLATIISFEPKEDENEITVHTDKGFCHLDFLVKLDKKNLYYVKEVEIETYDQDQAELTGRKTITVYEVKDTIPQKFFEIDIQIDENTEEQIDEWLVENGFEDLSYTLTQL